MTIVEVIWIDIIGISGWKDRESVSAWAKESQTNFHISVGYIVEETEQYLVLAQSYNESSDDFGGLLCIPKQNIQSMFKYRDET